MKHILFIIFEIALLYFLFGNLIIRSLLPKRKKLKLAIRDYERYLRKYRRVDYDIMSQEQKAEIERMQAQLKTMREDKETPVQKLEEALETSDNKIRSTIPHRKGAGTVIAEYLEIFVMALALAFTCRSFFLQPFKIPTGSMQPTLYGIHFKHEDPEQTQDPGTVKQIFDFLHYGKRHTYQEIREAGQYRGFQAAKSAIPFLPSTIITIGDHTYKIPGRPQNVLEELPRIHEFERKKASFIHGLSGRKPTPPQFDKGETLICGSLIAGDHIFVDRLTINFRDVKRGDITVFVTDGLQLKNGDRVSDQGRYYIKRLVGMPNETLMIKDQHLFADKDGDGDFQLINGEEDISFERIYSMKGGYAGYVTPNHSAAQYLTKRGEPVTLPNHHYFMLGDNTRSSQDSRFWGSVPRENIVGRAAIIWWPLSRRWGRADMAEPENVATESFTF
jgi:signal peptidase I